MSVAVGNVETIKSAFEAFGQGDVPAVLEKIADDVVWEHWDPENSAQAAGVPWLARRTGKQGAAEFFQTLASELEFHVFEPLAFMEGDGRVAVLLRLDVTVRATGRGIAEEEMHLYTFGEDGRITGMRHYIDTAKHIAAYRD
jgi:uncharacterized protein